VKRLLCASSMLALAACTGQLFQSKAAAPSVYLLSVNAATARPEAGPEIPVDLAVLRPRVRTGLDTDLIAVLYPDRRLAYVAGARWSGPLDEVVQDLALQAFRAHANLRNVHADVSSFGDSYWLEIEVADFQAEYSAAPAVSGGDSGGPTVHVHLLGVLGGSGDHRVLEHFEANERRRAAENRLGAIVEAYDQAVDAALARLVAETTATLSGNLERR
jgi:cholesterol transport system auxiliary component